MPRHKLAAGAPGLRPRCGGAAPRRQKGGRAPRPGLCRGCYGRSVLRRCGGVYVYISMCVWGGGRGRAKCRRSRQGRTKSAPPLREGSRGAAAELCRRAQRWDLGFSPRLGVEERRTAPEGRGEGRAAVLQPLSLGAWRANGTPLRAGGTPGAVPRAPGLAAGLSGSPEAQHPKTWRASPPAVARWWKFLRGHRSPMVLVGEKLEGKRRSCFQGLLFRREEAGFDLKRYLNLSFMNKALGKSLVCQRQSASGLTIREGW